VPFEDATAGSPFSTLASSITADLPKLVLKHEDSFLVADRRGDFPGLTGGEFGFYVDGTRFLHRLELLLDDQWPPVVLNAAVSEDTLQVVVDLTNPDVVDVTGVIVHGRTIRLARRIALHRNQLYQTLSVESFTGEPHDLALSWRFGADFVDVFEVRGFSRPRRGILLPPRHDLRGASLGYRGLDGVQRSTSLLFDPAPDAIDASSARYRLTIPPGGRVDLSLTVSAMVEPSPTPGALGLGEVMARRRTTMERRQREAVQIQTDHTYMNRWIDRSRTDLHMLLTETPDGPVPYAGIPWYVAPFGRDTLLTALQLLPFEPDLARGVLRFLARHQGQVDDPFTDQEPGKILHEYRRGELAACREIPFVPYYGTVDATPLFVILLAEYLRWTADGEFARELWPALERALGWLTTVDRPEGERFLTYQCRSPLGLANQGWKDSHDAVMHASGAPAPGPIALVEAQGYLYAALHGAADIADALGNAVIASRLQDFARRLKERFERDFWMEEEAFYALAIDGDGRPCRVISSNPGHCLWAGIVDETRAEAVAKRLMSEDLFSGWGLRTLAVHERRYNPMSYHRGSVWPHDTALAALGLRRYGFADAFLGLTTGLFEAVLCYEGLRMPELFCGFQRIPGFGPTRYPVACAPQAWAAGVVFHLLQGMLGLEPEAQANRLTLNRPILPPWLNWVELRGLRIRGSTIDLLLSRGRHGAALEVLARHGDAEVVVRR
jgi:glycogen debranching enzyme